MTAFILVVGIVLLLFGVISTEGASTNGAFVLGFVTFTLGALCIVTVLVHYARC